MNLAPIALFVYNRPWHTKQTVEALQKNEFAENSELFIYSDAPKNKPEIKNVEEVRAYIKTIDGFKKITIIERKKNWGLAASIIDGVTNVVNQFGTAIVLEDDLITSPFFLRFMNDGLLFYQEKERVMHISGYVPPITVNFLPDTFFLKPTTCWGWATWSRAWKHFEKNTDYLLKIFTNEMKMDFNLDNSMNYFSHVEMNKKGIIDTWAIYWYASVFLLNGLSLHPKYSFVKNIGFDGSGTHCKNNKKYENKLIYKSDLNLEVDIVESLIGRQALTDYYWKLNGPRWKSIVKTVLSGLNLIWWKNL